MIREKLTEKGVGQSKGFRWRGEGEISRIEGFSDAVFAFAVTLLVISLEVPETFTALLEKMRGFVAFAIGFALLFMIWFYQYLFFRRYGLKDNLTVWLNAALLFVVLFFVYPLKFLFTFLIHVFTGGHTTVRLPDGTIEQMVEPSQGATMMIIYGLGYMAVFLVFTLLYLHAYRKRAELELNELEVFDTRSSIQQHLLQVLIGLASTVIAIIGGAGNAGWAGFIYLLIGPILATHGMVMGKRRRRLEERFI